jgi:hypothetical protein
MKRRIIFLVVIFLFSSAFSQAPEPSKNMDWKQELTDVDVKGRVGAKRDRKIFANMLFFYGQLRQTAEGSLEMLRSISDFALKSFNVLVRVENVVKTAQALKESFKEYDNILKNAKNPFDLFDKTVTHTYTNVIMKGTDVMWLETAGMFNDFAALNDARQKIAVSTVNIGKTWDLERDTVWTVSEEGDSTYSVYFEQEGKKETLEEYQKRKLEEYNNKKLNEKLDEIDVAYDSAEVAKASVSQKMTNLSVNLRYQSKMAAQAVNMTDPRLIKKYEFNPQAKRKGATAEVMSSSMGNVSSRRQQHENNFAELQYAITMASSSVADGENSLTTSAKAEVLGAENSLLSTYIEHETLNDFIKVMSALTFSKMESLTGKVYQKAHTVVSADKLAILANDLAKKAQKEAGNE